MVPVTGKKNDAADLGGIEPSEKMVVFFFIGAITLVAAITIEYLVAHGDKLKTGLTAGKIVLEPLKLTGPQKRLARIFHFVGRPVTAIVHEEKV